MPNEKRTGPVRRQKTTANGHLTVDANGDSKTDYSRWRLRDVESRHTWVYLKDEGEAQKHQQTVYEKYFLGLPTVYFPTPPIVGESRI
jgi:lanosterol synthase